MSLCVCMQLAVAKNIIAEEGVGSLYKGLSAGLLRQATYTTARLGIFNYLSDYLKKVNEGRVSGSVSLHKAPVCPHGRLACCCCPGACCHNAACACH